MNFFSFIDSWVLTLPLTPAPACVYLEGNFKGGRAVSLGIEKEDPPESESFCPGVFNPDLELVKYLGKSGFLPESHFL